CLERSGTPLYLHSFPTRRSSDLDASVAWVRRDKLSPDHQDFHSLSWLIELSFERGRRRDAEQALALYASAVRGGLPRDKRAAFADRKSTRLNSSHVAISYAGFCL